MQVSNEHNATSVRDFVKSNRYIERPALPGATAGAWSGAMPGIFAPETNPDQSAIYLVEGPDHY